MTASPSNPLDTLAPGDLTEEGRAIVERLKGRPDDLLTLAQIAAAMGLTVGSLRVYNARARDARRRNAAKPTDLPEEDMRHGRTPGWRRETVWGWAFERLSKDAAS